jgi:hypothetical protein
VVRQLWRAVRDGAQDAGWVILGGARAQRWWSIRASPGPHPLWPEACAVQSGRRRPRHLPAVPAWLSVHGRFDGPGAPGPHEQPEIALTSI